ncbi:DUF5076 domain-containing protein [Sphingosinicellaceae bacterium]|nr:DUF5076 domain-containing protein [Sphingosinicellaceae bacterium]
MDEPLNAIKLNHEGQLTDDSWEIARVWINNGAGSHVWIAAWALEGPENFGHLMVDTMRHAAQAYADNTGMPPEAALQMILAGVMGDLRDDFAKLEQVAVREPG